MNSEQVDKIIPALIAVQSELRPATKDAENPYFSSSYATLKSVWETAQPVLSKNGLAITQTGDGANMCTTLWHASGQWIKSCIPIVNSKGDAQGMGSAVTYARRYGLSGILAMITEEDDDGNSASNIAPHDRQTDWKPEAKTISTVVPVGHKAVTVSSGWKNHAIHFGKNEGKKLGELLPKQLEWYIKNFEPKPYKGRISQKDTDLKSSLDAAKKELEKVQQMEQEGVTVDKDGDNIPF